MKPYEQPTLDVVFLTEDVLCSNSYEIGDDTQEDIFD